MEGMEVQLALNCAKNLRQRQEGSSWKPRFEVLAFSPLESNAQLQAHFKGAEDRRGPNLCPGLFVKGQVPERFSADLQKLESNILVQ